MIEGISRINARIGQIANRIDRIKSFGKMPKINTLKKHNVNLGEQKDTNGKSFQEILNEAIQPKGNNSINPLQDGGANFSQTVGTRTESQKLLVSIYKNIKPENNNITDIIQAASQSYGVDASLIKAVIQQESQFKQKAVSKAGAKGLMQLMPKTAKQLGVQDVFDAKQNIFGGTRYLKGLIERYKGNLTKALAAYNAGPDAVDKAGGIPNFAETKQYVPKVLDYYQQYKNF